MDLPYVLQKVQSRREGGKIKKSSANYLGKSLFVCIWEERDTIWQCGVPPCWLQLTITV